MTVSAPSLRAVKFTSAREASLEAVVQMSQWTSHRNHPVNLTRQTWLMDKMFADLPGGDMKAGVFELEGGVTEVVPANPSLGIDDAQWRDQHRAMMHPPSTFATIAVGIRPK